MKKYIKIILIIICIIVFCFILDLIFIFTFKRPLFGIEAKTPYTYTGLFYNIYICPEYNAPQIKLKGSKFSCNLEREELIVKEIIDTSKEIKDFACAEALESFYKDGEYTYYYSCIKSEYVIVKYENGFEETVEDALKYGTITIEDLDRYNIDYLKYKE